MATYESIIKIKGAVGDLVFYNLNGKNVVRKKSGFNKTAFKKNPSYEKVRQNSSEFGHCSKVGKIIRNSLSAYIKKAGDPLLYQKFAKLMTEIKDLDAVSERGKRTVENGLPTEAGKKLLREFQFGEVENLVNVLEIQNQFLMLKKSDIAATVFFSTIKLNWETYSTEYTEKKIILDQQYNPFKIQFASKDVLHFAVLKDDNNEITHMGFL